MVNDRLGEPHLISFLLVEDDDDHAHLVIRGLEDNRVTNRIDHVKDGVEALDYLFQRGKYRDKARPDIILLDLKLPRINGHEVLRQIKEDKNLKIIPVIILTTSNAEPDRVQAYEEHANSYLVKPLDFTKFLKMTNDLKCYWGVWNQPPNPTL